MHRNHALYLIGVSLALALIAFAVLSRSPQAPIASANGRATFTVYLPIVLKNTGCGTLTRDGGFEASTSGTANPYWQTTTNVTRTIFDNSSIPVPNPTHGGAWKVWLGGDNLLQQNLTQTLSIPTGTTNLQISFWWLVDTAETNPQGFDVVNIQIRDNAGVVQETLHHLFDLDGTDVWTQKIVTATQSYAGQSIQLAFNASTDSVNPTSFFIDDVSMTCQ